MNFRLVSVLLLFVLLIGISHAFAATQITLDTNKKSFSAGDLIELTGKVADKPDQLVAVEVKDSDGNTILIRTVQTDTNGNFVLKFKVPSTAKSGTLDIIAKSDVEGESLTKTLTVSASQTAESQTPTSQKSGGCLIATAAFGSEMAPQVQQLRETRDNIVMKTQSGATFMTAFNSMYYSFAPPVAEWERENPFFKEIIKTTITPLITTLSILNYLDIDSEAEMLGYGIGIISLNIGMYFVAPAFVILRIKRYKK